MRIDQASIEMSSFSYKKEVINREQTISAIEIKVDVEEEKQSVIQQQLNSLIPKDEEINTVNEFELTQEDYDKIRLLEHLIFALTGKKFKFILPKNIKIKEDASVPNEMRNMGLFGIQYNEKLEYKTEKAVDFNASGVIKTKDGREISFDMSWMKKESFSFKSETHVEFIGNLIDPLVINYDGKFANLSKKKFAFDIDFDGTVDQISYLEKGSGFLAFDKNENGKIDDGRELFGPQTGNGFAELAKYDEDQNGFIDENDAIFNQLRIWQVDDDGNHTLLSLGEVGIGAIYLGHVAANYELGGGPDQVDGVIRNNGIFIKESGEVGMVHHVDLTI